MKMGRDRFTQEQLWAADTRGGSVLVSAAAGSGKTTVLVERVIGMLTDPDSPVSADRLLIVTFMRDAATEMRDRLGRALSERIEKEPNNIRLHRQKMLLQKATIGTIHSFCNLCLKEFFASAGIAPDFRVVETAEMKMIRNEVLSELIEREYADSDEAFSALIDLAADKRGDAKLNDLIVSLDCFVGAFPEPEEKLNELARMYEAESTPENTVWGAFLLSYCSDYIKYTVRCAKRAIERVRQYPEVSDKYIELFATEAEMISTLVDSVSKGWDCAYNALKSINFVDLSKNCLSIKNGTPGKKEGVAIRSEYKKIFVDKVAKIINITGEEFISDRRMLQPAIKKLCELTLEYRRGVAKKKSERRALDFDDLERLMVKLLVRKTPEGYVRTAIARELSDRFDEILLDEYQDTNYTQDLIFRAISKENSDVVGDGTNMFMVGDIKQSIYRFRKAVPKLFLDRLNKYKQLEPENLEFPLKITLGKNFRSRVEVTDAVNFLFEQLMTPERGGILYDSDEQRLICGRTDFPQADCMQTELHLLEGKNKKQTEEDESENNDSRDIVEARYCARLIRKMVDEGFMVTGKNGLRPVEYGDFCIMRRSIKGGHGDAFISQLSAFGIPVSISTDSGFFRAPEICTVLSLLRAIDNPLLDISLFAALCSPIFGFDCDRLTELRSADMKCSLYANINAAAQAGDEDCVSALKLLSELRDMSAAMPSDRLISAIYRRTGCFAAVQAMKNGEERKENLLMLLDHARSFESSGYKGLSRFINAIDRLIENGEDFACASVVSDSTVNVRTIHKAKGLEFPVCIIAGMGGKQNSSNEKILLHNDLGIGMKVRDKERLLVYNTAQCKAVKLANMLDDTDEELRVLYVAMTRPIDKLIMVSAGDAKTPLENYVKSAADMLFDGRIDPFSLTLSPSAGKWITAAALKHPSAGELRELAGISDDIAVKTDVPLDIRIIRQNDAMLLPAESTEQSESVPCEPDYSVTEAIGERLNYKYPYEYLHNIPTKVTASGTHSAHGSSVAGTRPSFMQEKGLSAAERGTAQHKYMQFCDFGKAAQSPEAEAERLVSTGHLSAQEASAVDYGKVRRFFSGEMSALLSKTVSMEREWRFTALLEPEHMRYFVKLEGFGDKIADEPVVLEGECDLLLFTDDGAVVVDYKTDRVSSPEQLIERYAPQLELYASAVRQVTGLQNVSCRIYSFTLSQLINVN